MDLFDLFAKISLDTSEYETGLEKASGKLKGFASGLQSTLASTKGMFSPAVEGFKQIEGVGKTAGSYMVKGAQAFGVASTAVAGFGGSAVKAGMSFDAAMSQVSAISGATGGSFDALRSKAMEMGAKTKFSATEAAEAMNYMAMAGWKDQDMLNGIAGIMDLAAASGEDLASTSDIVTDALTAFGLTASDSGHFADVLAAASSNANTNVGMMGETFKYVAPLAGAMGYSAEDTALAIGLMAGSGIKGSQAGTSLRSVLTRLVKPTKESGTAMDALGISVMNSDGSMKSLGDVIGDLRTAFSGLTKEEKTSYAAMLGGQEAMSGLLAIVNATPEEVAKLTGALEECDGAAKKMADTMMDNLAGDIQKFKSNVETLQITISDALTPTLRGFAQFGTKAMEQLTSGFQAGGMDGFFSALTSVATNAVAILAKGAPRFVEVSFKFVESLAEGILNARNNIILSAQEMIGILVEGLNGFISSHADEMISFGLSLVRTIFQGFAQAGSVISQHIGEFIPLIVEAFLTYHETLFTVGIDILGAIGRGLVENKEKIGEMASNTVRSIALAIGENAPDIIEGAIVLLEALANAFVENWPIIAAVGTEIITKLVEGISTSTPAFVAGIALLFPHITKIIDVVGNVVNFVTGGNGIGKVLSVGKTLMSGISGLFSLITSHPIITIITAIVGAVIWLWNNCEEFREAVIAIWEAIVAFFQQAAVAIQAAWEGIVDFFQSVWDGIVKVFQDVGQWFADVFTAAWNGIKAAWDGVVAFFQGIWQGIVGAFQGVAAWFGDIFSQAWQAIKSVWDAVAGFFSAIAEGIRSVFSGVMEAVSGFFTAAWQAVKSAWDAAVGFFQGIWDGIQRIFSVVADVLGGFFSAAWEAVTGIWEAASGFFQGIWDAITGIFQGVAEWFGNLFTNAWNAITKAWDSVTDFFSGIWEDIQNVFANVWDAFWEIGGNIVQGIWDGISGAWGNFTNWLGEKVGGIVNTVKGWLGIHSPSTVFAEIGGNMMAGLENGADGGLGAVDQQMLKTVETMQAAFATTAQMFAEIGQKIMDSLSNALGGAIQNINAQMVKTVTVMQMAFSGLSGMFSAIGTNAMQSLVGSMEAGIRYLQSRVANLMYSIANAARAALGIHSPSKVFASMGENMALGIAEGWGDEFSDVKRSIVKGLDFGQADMDFAPRAVNFPWQGSGGQGMGGSLAGGRPSMTVIINSPETVDGVQAAHVWEKTVQRMAMAY